MEFQRYSILNDSEKVTIKKYYQRIISGNADESEYAFSLKHLSQMLREHYGIAPVIIIGLNNLSINSILDDKYSQYFGFTAEEVRAMAISYDTSEKYNEICEWYDGYRFGQTEIFNPWSVLNYFNKNCKPERFWENTGSNAIIGEVLEEADVSLPNKEISLVYRKEIINQLQQFASQSVAIKI